MLGLGGAPTFPSHVPFAFKSRPRTTTARAAAVAVVENRSLYEVLRVGCSASQTEIKAAYRTLAKLYHPDAAASTDGRDFIEIRDAYTTLSDPDARAAYDFNSQRPRSTAVVRSGYYPTQRWETDQCW